MNFNAIIAVLVIKQIITQDEGQALVEHLHDKPQSTELRDSIAAVGEIIGAPVASTVAPLTGGPAQQAEELAARSALPTAPVAPPPTPLEPANTQGPDNVTGPDQSNNPASLESEATEHADKSTMTSEQNERQEDNAKVLDNPNADKAAPTEGKADDSTTAPHATDGNSAQSSSDKSKDDKNTSNKKSSKK